jgi:phosphoglycerate dehydrogenase-like enzyme
MVGYGMIGKAVAISLKGRGIQTSVYDTAAFERHEATKR